MKKYFLCFLILFFCSNFISGEYNKYVLVDIESMKITKQQDKVLQAIVGCLGVAIGIWGFNEKTTYGYTTGILFSLRGIYNIVDAFKENGGDK